MMPSPEQIAKARERCKGMSESHLRRRSAAITSEIFSLARIGEQSEAAERRREMLEAAERIINAELRERYREEAR